MTAEPAFEVPESLRGGRVFRRPREEPWPHRRSAFFALHPAHHVLVVHEAHRLEGAVGLLLVDDPRGRLRRARLRR